MHFFFISGFMFSYLCYHSILQCDRNIAIKICQEKHKSWPTKPTVTLALAPNPQAPALPYASRPAGQRQSSRIPHNWFRIFSGWLGGSHSDPLILKTGPCVVSAALTGGRELFLLLHLPGHQRSELALPLNTAPSSPSRDPQTCLNRPQPLLASP